MFPSVCLLHPVTEEYVAGKRLRGLCRVWKCVRKRRWNGPLCETCHSRLHRLRHPEHYAFVALKASAYKRKIKFELTFQEFKDFIAGTDYMARKGTDPDSLTIDRRFTDQPYRAGNLRIMSHADNSSHRYEEKACQTTSADF